MPQIEVKSEVDNRDIQAAFGMYAKALNRNKKGERDPLVVVQSVFMACMFAYVEGMLGIGIEPQEIKRLSAVTIDQAMMQSMFFKDTDAVARA